jgi:hypothetical protein
LFPCAAFSDYAKAKLLYDAGNFNEAYKTAIASAESEDKDSLNLIGLLFLDGLGIKKNMGLS